MVAKIKTSDIRCQKFNTVWHAYHTGFKNSLGVGKTADDAIKDFRKVVKKKFQETYTHRFTYGAGVGGQ